MSREVYIVAYGRSAVCRSRKGSFAGTHPAEYGAQVLNGVLDQIPQLDRADIEDVIVGCAVQERTCTNQIAKHIVAIITRKSKRFLISTLLLFSIIA